MAWTTSACLRALPCVANSAFGAASPSTPSLDGIDTPLRDRTALYISVSAISLAFGALVLPPSLVACIVLLAGMALAMVMMDETALPHLAAARDSAAEAVHAHPEAYTVRGESARQPRGPVAPKRPERPQTSPTRRDWADLMARIHHELRTPLNAVVGFSEVMSLEMFGPLGNERYRDYARHIHESAGELLKSTEDTLALTALLTGPHAADGPLTSTLDHVIADAWASLDRKAAARNVVLDPTVPAEAEVVCDPRVLRQVLVNLLSEAITRTAPGGRISLLAVADAELIEIVVTAGRRDAGASESKGSLAVCLARTLLEMQGTSLLEIEPPSGAWSVVTVLDRAVQPDFFSGRSALARHGATHAL